MCKKILALVLCFVMLCALVSCDNSAPAVPSMPSGSSSGSTGGTTEPVITTTSTKLEDNRLWLKVATYNIQHGQDDDPNRTGPRCNLDNMVKVIKENNIDICGFNEIEINAERSAKHQPEAINQPKYIAEKLTQETGEQYYYAYAVSGLGTIAEYDSSYEETDGKAAGCNAIVSKYRIVGTPRAVKVTLSDSEIAALGESAKYYEARVLLIAQVEIEEGKNLTVISTHFGLTTPEQTKITDMLEDELVSQRQNPVVLMGDFNVTPTKQPITRLKAKLHNTSPGNQITYIGNGLSEIDYIFVSKTLQTRNYKVLQYPYSDHMPVSVEILWG